MDDDKIRQRLSFVKWLLETGRAYQGDTFAVETVKVPELDFRTLSWRERARLYGVPGLPRQWWSGDFRHGIPIPSEEYFRAVEHMYGSAWLEKIPPVTPGLPHPA
jgi:hypothetical protein